MLAYQRESAAFYSHPPTLLERESAMVLLSGSLQHRGSRPNALSRACDETIVGNWRTVGSTSLTSLSLMTCCSRRRIRW